nr:reverse transcriptase domain-containing protein [Tanacetum cinerariifolium]
EGEACPTNSGFIADQDRATISKSSTLPHDLAPRVTSHAADEGSMQHNISELTALCTSLQRQYSKLLAKFQAQEEEIVRLKERVQALEDKEGVAAKQSRDDASINGRSINEGEAAAERISNDLEEIARVLTSKDAATVLAGGIDVPTGSVSIPTAGPHATVISTGSEVGPTASLIVIRRKGKEVMVRKSTTGGSQFLGRRLISWQCKKQTILLAAVDKFCGFKISCLIMGRVQLRLSYDGGFYCSIPSQGEFNTDFHPMVDFSAASPLRACPHHGFSELHQLDTFYNALNVNDQDSLNSAAVVAKVSTSSSTPAISSKVSEIKDMVKALLLDKKNQSSALAQSSTPTPVKAVEPNCVTCGGSGTLPSNTITNPKEDLKGITTRSGVAYQGSTIPTPSKVVKQGTEPVVVPVSVLIPNLKPSIPYPSRRDNERRRDLANEQIEKFYKIFNDMSFEISFTDALILMPKFASTLKGLIGNKEKLSEIARTLMNEHCSAVILNKLPRKHGDHRKFFIPCEFPGMDECLALADLGASINLMPLSVWEGLLFPELTPTCMTLELADHSVSKPIGIAKHVSVKVGVIHFPADFVVVDFKPDPRVPLILGSGNPTPYNDPIVSTTSLTLTPFEDSDFLLFEEADAFREPLPLLPNHDQYMPSFKKELKVYEAKIVKSSIDEPPEVKLKDLPPHLEYVFLEGDNKLPVTIAKELGDEEKSALIKVLKSRKRAIAWKLSDIHGINPEFYTHKILMEENYKPAVQHQRRVNPKIHDIIKKEVEKLLDSGLIYSICDSP